MIVILDINTNCAMCKRVLKIGMVVNRRTADCVCFDCRVAPPVQPNQNHKLREVAHV